MIREREDCHAVNEHGLRIFIGPVPGDGPVIGVRKVDMAVGAKTHGIPHATKLNADGNAVEYRATINGWVAV